MDDGTGVLDAGTGRRRTIGLAAMDLGAVAVLIVVGQLRHGVDPITDPFATLESIVPFAIGWIAVAALAGLYSGESARTPVRAARQTALCWLAAANVGFLLRGSPLFDGAVPWSFTVVLTGLGLVVLLAWRVGFSVLGRSVSTASH